MADARKRESERAAVQGDTRDRARFLAQRQRAGELGPGRLRLAAFLGDAAARAVVGGPERGAILDLSGLEAALFENGKPAGVRCAIAAARWAMPLWQRARGGDPRPVEAVTASVRWLGCPCERHAVGAQDAALTAHRVRWDAVHRGPGLSHAVAAASSAAAAAGGRAHTGGARAVREATAGGVRFEGRTGAHLAARLAVRAVNQAIRAWASVDRRAPADIDAALRAALVPWALREGDPVLEQG